MNIPEPTPGGKQLGHGEGNQVGNSTNTVSKGPVYGNNGHTTLTIRGNWPLIACVMLIGTLCIGLGMIVARENQKPKDSLWIEQLPKDVLPSTASSLPSSTTMAMAASVEQGSNAHESGTKLSASVIQSLPQDGIYVASKTGKKYYLPTCGAAKRIKEENKVWFKSKADAEKAGYSASTACKGI